MHRPIPAAGGAAGLAGAATSCCSLPRFHCLQAFRTELSGGGWSLQVGAWEQRCIHTHTPVCALGCGLGRRRDCPLLYSCLVSQCPSGTCSLHTTSGPSQEPGRTFSSLPSESRTTVSCRTAGAGLSGGLQVRPAPAQLFPGSVPQLERGVCNETGKGAGLSVPDFSQRRV